MEEEQWDLIADQGGQVHSGGSGSGSSLIEQTIKGSFLDVLSSTSARQLLSPFARAAASLDHQSSTQPLRHVDVPVGKAGVVVVDALAIAVASLHVFTQLNWTGPDLPDSFSQPIALLRRVDPDAFPPRGLNANDDHDSALDSSFHQACLEELTWNGEPAYHLCQSPFFLLFALRLLQSLPDELVTLSWWRLRAESIHSRILDTPVLSSSTLFALLDILSDRLSRLQMGASTAEDKQRWGSMLAKLCIDRGLALQRCGADKDANDLFVKAAEVNGLRYEVTGSLGKRTKFQREDKTILVLLAESRLEKEKDTAKAVDVTQEHADEVAEEYDESPSCLPSQSGWMAGPSANREAGMPSVLTLNDETLLEQTRFTSTSGTAGSLSHLDVTKPSPLHPLDASILLALSLNINNTSPENGLTSSQISAFVSRVLAHARNWSVHTMGLFLRSRLEASRTRTAQRSVLQLQALLDQMPTSDSSLRDRLLYFHELELPSKWDMQAELARRYAALGVVRSALEIFERIEMWEEAVQCWGALGRQDRGIEVVRDLLEGKKVESSQAVQDRRRNGNQDVKMTLNNAREAKLWCLLGDLEVGQAREHYLKAWQVSLQRSARAARSIAGLYFAQCNYQKTILWLRRALKVNPLYSRSWFVLGCAYMRLDSSQGYLEASRCFRRCTALDDEDGESWNNLASCYLRLSQQGRSVLYDAHLSETENGARDATEVLDRVPVDDDGADEEADRDSLHSIELDSAVEGSDIDSLDEKDATPSLPSGGGTSSAFDVKLLAHRALTKSLRFSYDDWRIWNNYMIVSIDCGIMGEAVRGLTRVVELRSSKSSGVVDIAERQLDIDAAVLNRLVDAVTRAPSKEEDAIESSNGHQGQANHSPHEGHGLYPALVNLFSKTILPRISSSAAIYRCYARLLLWRGLYRSALEAHLNAWRVSYGSDANVKVTTEKDVFIEAIEELKELCEILENFGDRLVHIDEAGSECEAGGVKKEAAMGNWKFRARSLIRAFTGRTKDSFEGEPEWDALVELRDSFTKGA